MNFRSGFFLMFAFFCALPALARNPDIEDRLVSTVCKKLEEIKKNACARLATRDDDCLPGEYAIIKNSCIIDKNYIPIQELAPSTKVNLNADLLSKYDSRDIAKNLIYRYYVNEELPNLSDQDIIEPFYSYHQWVDVQIAFDQKNLDGIVKDGFLNQHRTSSSNGSLNHVYRLMTEKDMLNFDAEDIPLLYDLLPKYSYAVPALIKDSVPGFDYSSYGYTIAVLKDEVRKRATITPLDSLGKDYSSAKNSLLHSFYWTKELSRTDRLAYYWETQIWGQLTLNDVRFILVNCFGNTHTKEEIDQLFEKTQLPIYSCKKITQDESHTRYVRDQILRGKAVE